MTVVNLTMILLSLFVQTPVQKVHDTESRPNIIFFLTDDYGWQDTSLAFWMKRTQFNERYRTPTMERLVQRGVMFTNAYAACSVCSPSRISILTGQDPVRHKTTFVINRQGNNTPEILSARHRVSGMDDHAILLPKLLKESGYRTICVGKTHVCSPGHRCADPTNLGFERHHYSPGHGSPVGKLYGGKDAYHVERDGKQIHLSHALTLEAIKEISAAVSENKPFFLYLAHYAVHTPILEDQRFSANYPNLVEREKAYATLVEGCDKSLKDIVDHVEKLGIGKRTILIYSSDNGGYTARGNCKSPYGNPIDTLNWPLRSGKNDAYEGGHRIPSFTVWITPDQKEDLQKRYPIQVNQVQHNPIIHQDWILTILNMTGVRHPKPETVDGYDISGYLHGDSEFKREETFFWHEPNYWSFSGPESSMRRFNWKLIFFYEDQHWELYDLSSDLSERHNLIHQKQNIARSMALELRAYLRKHNARYPRWKESGLPIELTIPGEFQ